MFDPEPLTPAQREQADGVFERLIEEIPFFQNQLRAAQARFRDASTPLEERAALQALRNPFLDSGLGPEFGIATAGAGSYLLTLTVDGQVRTGTLTVREDPILSRR